MPLYHWYFCRLAWNFQCKVLWFLFKWVL